jgi:hypothetical protein
MHVSKIRYNGKSTVFSNILELNKGHNREASKNPAKENLVLRPVHDASACQRICTVAVFFFFLHRLSCATMIGITCTTHSAYKKEKSKVTSSGWHHMYDTFSI